MSEEILNFELETGQGNMIKVVGVGGGGGNAVKHMFRNGIVDVSFAICNTDSQALLSTDIPERVSLGNGLTGGLGAGNKPEVGRAAALESLADIDLLIDKHTRMVFVAAGMGGGTGTGAAPVIAERCKEKGMLTIGIVTIPSRAEGKKRQNQALEGIKELEKHVDSLIVINSERIRDIYGNLPLRQAFAKADDILLTAAKGVSELITLGGKILVDFEDVKTVMKNSGVANMGCATAYGENRALEAVCDAINSPLLCINNIFGAKDVLLNMTSGTGDNELTMDEINLVITYVQEKAGNSANIIWGYNLVEEKDDGFQVMIVVTGFASGGGSVIERVTNEKEVVRLSHDEPVSRPIIANEKDPAIRVREQVRREEEKEFPQQSTIAFSSSAASVEQEEYEESPISIDLDDDSEWSDELFEKQMRTPAYTRNLQQSMRVSSDKKEASRMALKRNADGEPTLRNGNSYLHDNVD